MQRIIGHHPVLLNVYKNLSRTRLRRGSFLMADNNFNSVEVVEWKVTGLVEKNGEKIGPAPEDITKLGKLIYSEPTYPSSLKSTNTTTGGRCLSRIQNFSIIRSSLW